MLDSSTDVGIQYNKNGPQPFNIRIICDGDDCPYWVSGTGGAAPQDTLSFSMCGKSVVAYNPILEGSSGDLYTDKLRIPRSDFLGPQNLNCAPGTKSGDIEDSSSGNKVMDVPSEFNIDYKTSGGTLRLNKWDEMKYWRLQSGGSGTICIAAYLAGDGCTTFDDNKQAKTNTILTPFGGGTGHVDNLNDFLKEEDDWDNCFNLETAECNRAKASIGSTGWASSCNGDCPLGHESDGNRPDYDLRGEIILSDSGKFYICDSELNGFKFMDGKTVTSSGDNFAEDTFECQNDRWEPTSVPDIPPPPVPVPDNRYEGCTDGGDTDGDGRADSGDPGCVKPFGRDGDEADYRDTDMSATFGGVPSASSASVTQGGETFVNAYLSYVDGINPPSIVREYYNQKGEWSKSPSGAIPDRQNVARSPGVANPASTYFASLQDFFQKGNIVVDTPFGIFNSPGIDNYYCGNGQRNTGEDNFNCPKDYGLPDDVGDTKVTSGQTITQQLGSASDMGWTSESDPLTYNANLNADEASGTKNEDVRNGGSSKTYDATSNGGFPDFYMNSDPAITIYQKTLDSSNNQFGSTTDWDTPEQTGDDYDSGGGSVATGCSGGGGGEKCTTNGKVCTSISSNQQPLYTLTTETDTHTASTETYYTTNAKPNINEQNTALGLTVNVQYNPNPGAPSSYVEADNCGGKSQTYSYTCFNASKGCGGGITGYSDKKTSSSITYEKKTSTTYTYSYEDLTWANYAYFATDPASSTISPPSGLWGGAVQAISFNNNRHYWSVAKDDDSYFFDNDEAVASSEMKITHNGGNNYWSTREWYGLFDADGPDGTGDSYITIGEPQKNEPFNAETSLISPNGDDPGRTYGLYQDFVDAKGAGCGEWFCVSAQDVYLQNLNSWGSPTSPSTGIKIDDTTKPVSADYSVCRTFQEMIGGVNESYLRCQYDDSRSFPEGPTASYPLKVID